jgi:hypothetical protein
MLTVSNLAQRQKQALNNVDEKFKQMKRVPVGGYGALIQRPNQTPVKQNVTPTLFNPTPMSSSLPYLADHSKFRSNINQILMQEHIKIQRDNLKASLDFDSVKIGEYEEKKIDNKIMQDIHAPNTRELMGRYLSGEIKDRQESQFNAATARRDKLFRELNPGADFETVIASDEPPKIAVDRIPDVTLGDLGRAEEAKRKELLRSAFDTLRKRETLDFGLLRGLVKQRESDIRSELEKRSNPRLKQEGNVRGQKNKFEIINEIIEKMRKGKRRPDLPSDLSQRKYETNLGRLNGDDGDGLLAVLKGRQ